MAEKVEQKKGTNMLYGVDENPPIGNSVVYALQWLLFSTGLIILVPGIIGPPLGLDAAGIAELSTRVFFFTGLASLLQALFGHRMPLVEGPSGLWYALIVGLGTTASAVGNDLGKLRTDIVTGLIVGGVVVILIAVLGLLKYLLKLFTPAVTGSVLALLTMQLAGGYVKGALGVGFQGKPISGLVTLISVIIIAIVVVITLKAPPMLRSVGIFAGMVLGWIVYTILGYVDYSVISGAAAFGLPKLFAWGAPTFDLGICLTCTIASVILISNVMASLYAVCNVSGVEMTPEMLKRGVIFNGLANVFAGGGCTCGSISYATAAGLVTLTGVASRLPFIIYSIILMIMGFFPVIGAFLATLPTPVANCVCIAAMCTLYATGVKDYVKMKFDNRDCFVLGLSAMVGVGCMFLPTDAIAAMPGWLSSFMSQGMITGMILCIVLDNFLLPKKLFAAENTAPAKDAE